jgi:hypothetical protein
MQDRHPIVTGLELPPGLLQTNDHCFIQRIHLCGAIDGDGGDARTGAAGDNIVHVIVFPAACFQATR